MQMQPQNHLSSGGSEVQRGRQEEGCGYLDGACTALHGCCLGAHEHSWQQRGLPVGSIVHAVQLRLIPPDLQSTCQSLPCLHVYTAHA